MSMDSVAAPIWNEIAKTQKLRTQWARERFPMDEEQISKADDQEAKLLLNQGMERAVMCAYLDMKPLLLERDAIQAYLETSNDPYLPGALPEVNSVNEAVILASQDRPLTPSQQKQLSELLHAAIPPEIDFDALAREFFMCYFGDVPDVTIRDLSRVLGVGGAGRWAKKFRAFLEVGMFPSVKRAGRYRVTLATLAAWFDFESSRRQKS